MLDGSAVLCEANEMDLLDRERLVRRRKSRRQPALVPPLIVTSAAVMWSSTKMGWISYVRPPKQERSHSLVAATPSGP
jgi:hypothetical protein